MWQFTWLLLFMYLKERERESEKECRYVYVLFYEVLTTTQWYHSKVKFKIYIIGYYKDGSASL